MKKEQNLTQKHSIISIVCIVVVVLATMIVASKYYGKSVTSIVQAIPTTAAPLDTIYQVLAVDPKGTILTDANGRSLYTYVPDPQNESVCISACSQEWLPYQVKQLPSMLPSNFTIITRNDRTKQYAYRGKALYYYIKDTGIGSTQGDGINGFWSLAHP